VPLHWVSMARDLGQSSSDFLGQVAGWARRNAPRLAAEVEQASDVARNAVSPYLRFLEDSVRGRARGSYAVGREFFEFLLRESHGLPDNGLELESFGREGIVNTQARIRVVEDDGRGGGG